MSQSLPAPEPVTPPARPALADHPPCFLSLEREVEIEYRPLMLSDLQRKVNAVAEATQNSVPVCPHCRQTMRRHDTRQVSWLAGCGCLHAAVSRYRCPPCRYECRPLLDLLDVEPGRISGALARLLALLASVAPYPLAARLAGLLLGVEISPMGIWRVARRLGESAARYQAELSRYHADSRSVGAPTDTAPAAVVLGVDGGPRALLEALAARKHDQRRYYGPGAVRRRCRPTAKWAA